MKKLPLLLLLFFSLRAAGQNTTVSFTMVDTDAQAWFSATWRIDFRPNPSQPNESAYRLLNGQPLVSTVTHQTGITNSSGAASIVVYDSTLITPSGSGWTLTLCPKASVSCGVYQFSTAGSTMNISSNLTTNFAAPRFQANGAGSYGYLDIEAMVQISIGGCYWNVTLLQQRCWNGTAFISAAGGFTGAAGNVNEVQINNGSGALGAASGVTYVPTGGLQATAMTANVNKVLSVTAPPYNAKCDLTTYQGNTGTPNITINGSTGVVSGTTFTAADNGKTLVAYNVTSASTRYTLSAWGTLSVSGTTGTISPAPGTTTPATVYWEYGTNDQAAIQQAFTDASNCKNGMCSVQFPQGNCLTGTIVYKGQSFFGANSWMTNIFGLPGQDVFQAPDAVYNYQNGVVRDIGIVVDGSVDASNSACSRFTCTGNTYPLAGNTITIFPNRVSGTYNATTPLPVANGGPPAPGPIIFGPNANSTAYLGAVTNGSTTFTLSVADFNSMPLELLVGAQIQVAAASGSTFSITAWSIYNNTITLQAVNTLSAGDIVQLSGFATSTFLNGTNLVVQSTGLSGTQFSSVLVGASIPSNGGATEAGTGTYPLKTTIVAPIGTAGSQVQMAVASSATINPAFGIINASIQPPWNVGNCGMAFPGSTYASRGQLNRSKWVDVVFTRTSSSIQGGFNHECGLFMQSAGSGLTQQHMFYTGVFYGNIEAEPANYAGGIASPDTNVYYDMNFNGPYVPFVLFAGTARQFDLINIYAAHCLPCLNMFWLTAGGTSTASGTINQLYYEGGHTEGEIARFSGITNILSTKTNWGSYPPPFDQYVNFLTTKSFFNVTMQALHVSGSGNTFKSLNSTGSGGAIYVTDTGQDNSMDGMTISSGTTNRRFAINRARPPSATPDAGFLMSSPSTDFTAMSDLISTCDEWNSANGGCTKNIILQNGVINDPGNITGSFAHFISNYNWCMGGQCGSAGSTNRPFIVGDRIPQSVNMLAVIKARCNAPCSQPARVYYYPPTGTGVNLTPGGTSVTLNFGTSWTTQTIPFDGSATNTQLGGQIQVTSFGVISGAGATTMDVQYIGIAPPSPATKIANGTAIMPSTSIGSGTCFTPVTVAASGVLSTDSLSWAFNADPGATWDSFIVQPYVTAGNVNFRVCNPPGGGTATPAAATVNWKVTR